MSRWAKFGIVMAGYGAAIVAGWLASWQYNARVAGLPYDTSGGMYAASEAMYSTAAFLVVALVPTLLLLWFLRHHEGFWNTMSVASLAFAAVGLLAVFSPLLFPTTPRHIGSLVGQRRERNDFRAREPPLSKEVRIHERKCPVLRERDALSRRLQLGSRFIRPSVAGHDNSLRGPR